MTASGNYYDGNQMSEPVPGEAISPLMIQAGVEEFVRWRESDNYQISDLVKALYLRLRSLEGHIVMDLDRSFGIDQDHLESLQASIRAAQAYREIATKELSALCSQIRDRPDSQQVTHSEFVRCVELLVQLSPSSHQSKE